ncbi:hypothetical protein C8Q74DRAFT_1243397 [Fomes fomentarius]|nr:hypothetical protein C8Q74DRAFT_1243397 [Fomes fomentarius]
MATTRTQRVARDHMLLSSIVLASLVCFLAVLSDFASIVVQQRLPQARYHVLCRRRRTDPRESQAKAQWADRGRWLVAMKTFEFAHTGGHGLDMSASAQD